jgi:hypothetical protein
MMMIMITHHKHHSEDVVHHVGYEYDESEVFDEDDGNNDKYTEDDQICWEISKALVQAINSSIGFFYVFYVNELR